MQCRKSVRDLSAAEKTAYVDAVLALKTTAPSRIPAAATAVTTGGGAPNRYDDYVWMHSVVGGGAHRGPAFGPWHREFLRQFELDLRQVSGNPDISIPYWDWTTDQTPASPGWPFTNDFMGGFGPTGPASEITTGRFSDVANWRMNIRHDAALRLERRGPGVPSPATLPTRAPTVLDSFTTTAYEATPYHETAFPTAAQLDASFRKYLEYLLHNGIHVWIGGANSSFTVGGHMTFPPVAVNDPVFFLHHANVDRLWTVWQQRNPALAYVPASGANPGHNAPDVMIQFANPANFNFPLANRPLDVVDYHARGVWYRSDLPQITPASLSVNFGNVPENLTTFRPVQFNVRTCQRVKFRVTAISAGNFSIPPAQGTVAVDHSTTLDPVVASVYLAFQASGPLSAPQIGTATVEAYIDDADGYFAPNVNDEYLVGSWTVNLTATPVPRPRAAATFVLDRSGSMSESAGVAGTKYDLLRSSLQVIADIMQPGDGIGLVSYDDQVATLASIAGMGPVSPPGPGRTAVANAVASGDLAPRGLTAIGSGMIQGAGVLDLERTNPATPYTRFAMVVMTDGNENVPPMVTSSPVTNAIAGFSDSVYAVGLGSVANVSAATLGAIARYMLITGDITIAEQRFRLTKYFVQILASVTRTAIVVDPQGDLALGSVHRIPFSLTEGDVGVDVIVLSPAAHLLDFRLQAPDGTVITAATMSPNVAFHTSREDTYYRLGLPAVPGSVGTHDGQWTAVLRVSRRAAATNALESRELADVLGRTGTLPYSLVVQSYSNILLDAEVHPTVARPGEVIALLATLREYDVPVEGRASVMVEVADPAGGSTHIPLMETAPGLFAGDYHARLRGLHTFRFKAAGSSLGGRPFQREETRTAAIFVPVVGDPRDPGPITDALEEERRRLCALLACLLERGGLDRFLERHDLDPRAFAACLEAYCQPNKAGMPRLSEEE
jgi:hypothetical protein